MDLIKRIIKSAPILCSPQLRELYKRRRIMLATRNKTIRGRVILRLQHRNTFHLAIYLIRFLFLLFNEGKIN